MNAMRPSDSHQIFIAEAMAAEWRLLQNQFDSYEKYSLLLKMLNITVLIIGMVGKIPHAIVLTLLLVIWLQDAIWKTFQSRIEARLLQLEGYFTLDDSEAREAAAGAPHQFNSAYLKGRGGAKSLLLEYARQALRPTVALSTFRAGRTVPDVLFSQHFMTPPPGPVCSRLPN